MNDDRIAPHTNTADAGLPHDTLVEYIDNLEERIKLAYVCIDEALSESVKTSLSLKRLNLALRLADLSDRRAS
jgi:hypothetical protein